MKIGFAGDEAPRYTERSLVGYSKNKAITSSGENRDILVGENVLEKQFFLDIYDCITPDLQWDPQRLEIIWSDLYSQKMTIDPSDFPVCFTLSPFYSEQM